MPTLSTSSSIITLLAGLTLLLFVWVVLLSLVVRRLSRRTRHVVDSLKGDRDIMEVISKTMEDIETLFSGQERLQTGLTDQRELLRSSVRHVGVVRYDAFAEVGGRLSFSAAFLNERGDGVVLTSINGRSDSRVYAKPIEGRRSTYALSEEEEKAISDAFKEVRI